MLTFASSRPNIFHWTALGLSALISMGAWLFASGTMQASNLADFQSESDHVVELLRADMERYETVLQSAAAHMQFAATQGHGMSEHWQDYYQEVTNGHPLPGFLGMGIVDLEVASGRFRVREFAPENRAQGVFDETSFVQEEFSQGVGKAHRLIMTPQSVESGGLPLIVLMRAISVDKNKSATPLTFVFAPLSLASLVEERFPASERRVALAVLSKGTELYAEDAQTSPDTDPSPVFQDERSMEVFGSNWQIRLQSDLSFRNGHESGLPILMLIASVAVDLGLLVSLVGLFRASVASATHAKKVTSQLQESEHSLKQRNDELLQFNYRISHDLVNPMKSILGLVHLAREDVNNGRQVEVLPTLEWAEKMVNQQIRVIESIFSLCQSDMYGEAFEDMDLVEVSRKAYARVMRDHKDSRVALRMTPRTGHVSGKPSRLEQILRNLISNSVKFASPSAGECWVEVDAFTDMQEQVLRVRDNGIGIPEKLQPRVFDLFFRGTSHESGGAGLGAYIVQRCAVSMGGQVQLYSDDNGTSVEVRWPREHDERASTETAT